MFKKETVEKMREKRRYLQFQVICSKKFSEEEAKHLVYESVFQLLGERGASNAAIQLKAFDPEKQLLLVKCSLASHRQVIASLSLKFSFRGSQLAVRLQRIFGTLQKAKPVFPQLRKAKG